MIGFAPRRTLVLLALLGPGAHAQAPDTKRVVTDARGKRVVLIRWAIGEPDNIVTLRQPLGHTSLWVGAIGAMVGPGYGDQTLKDRRSATTFSFAALLPDLRPRTPDNLAEFTRPGGGDKVDGLVESAVYEGNPRREQEQFQIHLKISRSNLNSIATSDSKPLPTVEKPGRHGLRRIGLDPNATWSPHTYVQPHDLYFTGDTPESSPLFITCDAEEVRSKEDDPRERIVPQCKHFFVLKPLSAIVRVRYRRVFLPDWRRIQAGVEQRLLSFLPGGPEPEQAGR